MENKNLLKNAIWSPWSPREELAPKFYAEKGKLKISTGNSPNVYGKFLSGEIAVSDRDMVTFSALFTCENVKNKENGVFAMISFYDGQKKLLERDYADIAKTSKKSKKKLCRKLDAPEGAAYLTVEIGARWCPEAVVEWDSISLETSDKAEEPKRFAKIATTFKKRRETREENLKSMIEIIEKAGKSSPDVILLSELVYESCYDDSASNQKAQPVPGPLTGILGEYAKKYNTYIIFTMNEKEKGAIYNTAVIIGRDGAVCGKYQKTHLPLTEAEWGTTPGEGHRVFDLDFGRIGVLICYDQFFPENWRTLALMGAEIIFVPTMGEDELVQRAIARTNGVHVVVAGYDGTASSRIINPLGEIANSVKDEESAYVTESIDLNKRYFVYWMSIGPGNGETRSLFEKERMTATYGAVAKESHKVKKT
ncbi:MAG: carbon-nitrogen hydrolase family protein [Oscillospiraceae bacterium]|nr:carbon-nitrogen hydrolase family protein [Oscillospiraceae bacterium]